MTQEKIDWYQEVLELDPGSKVFFPLAQLLANNRDVSQAVMTLQRGLRRHPEYIEARLFLVEVLFEYVEQPDAKVLLDEQLALLMPALSRYAGFWKAWSLAAQDQGGDTSVALTFLATIFQNKNITLSDIFAKGLDALNKTSSRGAMHFPSPATQNDIEGAAARLAPVQEDDADTPITFEETCTTADSQNVFPPSQKEVEGAQLQDLAQTMAEHSAETAEPSPSPEHLPEIPQKVHVDPPQESVPQKRAPQIKVSQVKAPQIKISQTKVAPKKVSQEEIAQEEIAQEEIAQEEIAQEKILGNVHAKTNISNEEENIAAPQLTEDSSHTPDTAHTLEQNTESPPYDSHPTLAQPPVHDMGSIEEEETDEEEHEERFSLRTRSMAEVLAEQGDYGGALEIYNELVNTASSLEEERDLQHRIATLNTHMGDTQEKSSAQEEQSSFPGKDRVLSVLETLAERLETRVLS